MSGHKIIDGLKDAVAGNFDRVTIEGQVWVKRDSEIDGWERLLDEIERLRNHVASAEGAMQEMIQVAANADAEIERLRAALTEIYNGEHMTGAEAMAIATAALSPQQGSGDPK